MGGVYCSAALTAMNNSTTAMKQQAQATIVKLDQYHEVALAGYESAAIMLVNEHVERVRGGGIGEDWRKYVDDYCRPHPLFTVFSQCPMTARCIEKPRGYAGDAVTLDLIYSKKIPKDFHNISLQGQRLFSALVDMPVCRSVDYRSKLIARIIDAFAERRATAGGPPIRVLSLACGHAKELEGCASLRNGRVAQVVALDQDELSLGVLRQRFANLPLDAQQISVRDILSARSISDLLGKFDFIYSTGLYDYLDQRVATRLTAKLFESLLPGGELFLANFHSNNHGSAYMEAFMDWWLIYRSDEELKAVIQDIDSTYIKSVHQFLDPLGNVTYLQVERST